MIENLQNKCCVCVFWFVVLKLEALPNIDHTLKQRYVYMGIKLQFYEIIIIITKLL